MMIVSLEIRTNPGPIALFVAEVRFEKSRVIPPKWWGLWLSWWLYKPKYWREWLWAWEVVREGSWRTWQVRLLGFEINWQFKGYRTYDREVWP